MAAFPDRAAALATQAKAASMAGIKAQILALEAGQPRMVREAVLDGDLTRLRALDAQITALRLCL